MCLLFTVVCGRVLYVARSGDFAVGQSYNSYTLLFEQNDTEITDRQGRSMGGTRKEWVAVIRPTQDCLRELPRLFAPGDVQRIAKEHNISEETAYWGYMHGLYDGDRELQ